MKILSLLASCNIETLINFVTISQLSLRKLINDFFLISRKFCIFEHLCVRYRIRTCSLVLITSAGVTNDAAGIPAIAPAVNKESGEL